MNPARRVALAALAAAALVGTGCIIVGIEKSGTRETACKSPVAATQVYVNGNLTGHRTPTSIHFELGRQYDISFRSCGTVISTVSISPSSKPGTVKVDVLSSGRPVVFDPGADSWHGLTSQNVDAILGGQ